MDPPIDSDPPERRRRQRSPIPNQSHQQQLDSHEHYANANDGNIDIVDDRGINSSYPIMMPPPQSGNSHRSGGNTTSSRSRTDNNSHNRNGTNNNNFMEEQYYADGDNNIVGSHHHSSRSNSSRHRHHQQVQQMQTMQFSADQFQVPHQGHSQHPHSHPHQQQHGGGGGLYDTRSRGSSSYQQQPSQSNNNQSYGRADSNTSWGSIPRGIHNPHYNNNNNNTTTTHNPIAIDNDNNQQMMMMEVQQVPLEDHFNRRDKARQQQQQRQRHRHRGSGGGSHGPSDTISDLSSLPLPFPLSSSSNNNNNRSSRGGGSSNSNNRHHHHHHHHNSGGNISHDGSGNSNTNTYSNSNSLGNLDRIQQRLQEQQQEEMENMDNDTMSQRSRMSRASSRQSYASSKSDSMSRRSDNRRGTSDNSNRRRGDRRGGRGSDYSVGNSEDEEDDDGYLVGRGRSIDSRQRSSRNSHRDNAMMPDDDASYDRRGGASGTRLDDSSSYGNLLDDESRAGGSSIAGGSVRNDHHNRHHREQWNMNKSVFSTLHDRLGRDKRASRRNNGHDEDDEDDDTTYSASSSYSHLSRNSRNSRSSRGRRSSQQQQQTPSRSSSIASRMSQLSQHSGSQRSHTYSTDDRTNDSNNSYRFPKKYYARSSNYEYDSDDSIGSLIGGGGGDDYEESSKDSSGGIPSVVAGGGVGSSGKDNVSYHSESSGSFLFDRKGAEDYDVVGSTKKDGDGCRRRRSVSPTTLSKQQEQLAEDFGHTFSNLENMGFGIVDAKDDGRVGVGDRDAGSSEEEETKDDDDDGAKGGVPWWIKDLEREGWFQHDTTVVYSTKVPLPKRMEDDDDDVHLMNEDELGESNHLGEPSSAVPGQEGPNAQLLGDDFDDTSTVGMEDEEDIQEWEERLWSLARSHYLEYSGSNKEESAMFDGGESKEQSGIDEQSVVDQEKVYMFDYEREQKGVLAFRTLLLKCVETYVDVFHRKVEERKNQDGSEDVEVSMLTEKGSEVKEKWSDHEIGLRVYPYVPMLTARALFMEVIQIADRGELSGEGLDQMNKVPIDLERRADVVTSVLADDALNIFRRYQVITVKTSAKKIGGDTKKSRKRLNKGNNQLSGGPQTALDNYLYGEMYDNADQEANEAPDILETKEHEMRIRVDIMKDIVSKSKSSEEAVYRSNALICKVLLSDIQSITSAKADIEEEKQDDSQLAPSIYLQKLSTQVDGEQPMGKLYSLRYSPIFYLKALTLQLTSSGGNGAEQGQLTYPDLKRLLFDGPYLIKRFELQGPYDATITHLSNWQSTFFFKDNIEKCQRDDNEEYTELHKEIASALYSHLTTTLLHTGYQESKAKKGADDGDEEKEDNGSPEVPHGKYEIGSDFITIHNYAKIVATCLEIGRALHHLGVCLGRRQRDSETNQNSSQTDEAVKEGDVNTDDKVTAEDAVTLELASYKNALEAYKGAIYVLSIAEARALGNTSMMQPMPDDELQEIREAKISVELHLADTLNCLGYCHDSKLLEYDKSLMAYRESLSLYIRHVGRFHNMVSNALHNMGAIHVELSQWREAASCFRQCLAILKRKVEKERELSANTHRSEETEKSQMFITLQCLGNSLAELGEYDASIACFQEIINSTENRRGAESHLPDSFTAEVLSQMARVHVSQASKLSRAFNWQGHTLLFSENESRKEEEPSLLLDRQRHIEQDGKTCIKKSIHSKRHACYIEMKTKSSASGGIFSSLDENDNDFFSEFTDNAERLTFQVSTEASSDQLAALAKDLLIAGQLEFRSRTYQASLSYCWESFLLTSLLISRKSNDTTVASKISDLLVSNDGFLDSEGSLFKVSEKILDAVDLVETPSVTDELEIEYVQLLYLIGLLYTRTRDFDKAKAVLLRSQFLLDPDRASQTIPAVKGSLHEAMIQLDTANILLRIGFIDHELGDLESASSTYKQALQLFNSTSTHPMISDGSKMGSSTQKDIGDNANQPLTELHTKELEMIIKNGLACALHGLGENYVGQRKSDKALKCFEDTAQILNEVHDIRVEFSDLKTVPALPIPSRCAWEEISAISTSVILTDANEYSGRIRMDVSFDLFSFQCFERAIGMREYVTANFGSLANVDTETDLECYDESKWDKRNMDCYGAMLLLIERREQSKGNKISDGEEKRWNGTDLDSEISSQADDGESQKNDDFLTKEDVLFRIGNLQAKSGRFRDAINSYKEAEELTVARLGTKDHSIIMNILHNMGNAYRAISLSSPMRESRSDKEEAIVCYSEAIRISQSFFGKQHESAAESMQSLAVLYMKAENAWLDILKEERSNGSDDELAYKSLRESLSIRRRDNGRQNELEIATILHNLGDLCLSKIGYYYRCEDSEALRFVDDSMNFLSESLKTRKMLLGQNHVNVGDTYQSLGIAHLNRALALKNDANKMQSEVMKASKALAAALEIRRTFTSTFNYVNIETKHLDEYKESLLVEANLLFYLGRVDETRSKHAEAKTNYIEALKLLQAEGKRRVSNLSKKNDTIDNPGATPQSKRLTELEAINLWTAQVLYHIANIHRATSNNKDAESCYQEALRIRNQCKITKRRGLNNALIHLDLAKAHYDCEEYDKAIECYSSSLRTYLSHFGKDSIDVADTLTGMGKSFAKKSMLKKMLQFDKKAMLEKAMQCFDKAMRVYEYREGLVLKEKKGLLHREIADTVQRMGGDVFEVLEHYRSSVSFLEEFNERHRTSAAASEKTDQELNKQLLLYYSEMLAILRQVYAIERDSHIKSELRDEIGDVLHRMGNLHATFSEYDEAMGCFSEVLKTLRRSSDDELRIADLLFNMGNIYLELGVPEKSLDCLHESYDITKEAMGEDNAELHSTMYLIGVALTKCGDYVDASKWLTKALSVLRSNEDDNIMDEAARGKTLHQTGTVYEKTGKDSKAMSCFQEAVQILKVVQGSDLELSNALNSMGNMLRNVSDFDQALNCYVQSLTIRSDLGDQLLIANTKNNIGAVLSATEDLERAMAFSAEALRIKTERLGRESVETARGLVNMGQLYLDRKIYKSAEKYFDRGLRLFQERREPDQKDVAMCIYKLGVIREALNDDDGAVDYYLQSTDILKSNDDKSITMAFSLHNTALIHVRQKDFAAALEYMKEALDTKMEVVGANHAETAASQHWLGTIHLELEDTDAAILGYKEALKVRVECFGTEHLDVAETLFGLGQVHFVRDEFEEAIECLEENLRVLRKFGCGDGDIAKSELLLGSSYQEMGQFETAIQSLSEALHTMVSAHGSDHLDVSNALFRLGICLCETNDYSASLEKFQEALEIRQHQYGRLHIECANTLESIGIVQQKSDNHGDAIHSFERALAIKKTSLEEDDEDFCVLLHFIGSSLFALDRYNDAVTYFGESSERKKYHYGRTDEEYAQSVIDLAAAYDKAGNEIRSMECYREAIESGGLASDSWELGVAHKCLAGYFFNQNMFEAALERYSEAVSIFEWNIDNVLGGEGKQDDIIQCYAHLLDLEDDNAGPISETRAELCYKLANSYVQVNKHEDAVLMYREAIMIQTQLHGTDHVSVSNSLHNLGNCYRSLCDFEKSAECLNKSLSLSTVNFGEENEEVADTCHCMALTLMSTCEMDEAVTLFERALTVRKKKLGALDLNIASTLYSMGQILQMKGNWSNALKSCKEALKIQRMTVGEDSLITASTLECIGRIHMDKREFEHALKCFNSCIAQDKLNVQRECGIIHQFRGESIKAQKMFLKAGLHAADQIGLSVPEPGNLDLLNLTSKFQQCKNDTLDKDLLVFAENIMYYGSVLTNLKTFNEALECFRFSNVIFQGKYGADHLTLSENLHRTGFVLEKMSDTPSDQYQLDEALELLTEALRIRKMHLVGSHPDLEETHLCLGKVHHKLGNIGEALSYLTEAVKARDDRLGRKHQRMDDADALLHVGQLHQQAGQFRQALDSYEDVLGIKRKILGRDHPSIGELLFYIGSLLREVGDLDSAQSKFEESLAIAEQIAPDSEPAAEVLFGLGVLHTEQKQYPLALDAYLGSLNIHKSIGSPESTKAEILNNIGITYVGMKDFHRAQVYHAEALDSLRHELGDNHSDVAFCWHSLGVVHQELSDQAATDPATSDLERAEALKCFQEAVGIERNELNLLSLGTCLVQLNDNENAFVCLDEALRMKKFDYDNDADDDLAEIQRHIGIIWMRRNKFDESLKCYEEALKIKMNCGGDSDKDHANLMNCLEGALEVVSELYGTMHIKYARLLHQKGNFHGAKKEHSLAIEAYVEALRIYKGEHGDSHLSVANTLFNLGVSLNAKGSPDKAIRCFVKALRITKARLGEDHLDVADTYEQVAESNKLLSNSDEAVNFYEKALHVRKQANGGSDLKSATIMQELGQIYSQQSLWDDAERAFKESIRVRTIQQGQDDPGVAESMYMLGTVYIRRSEDAKSLKLLEGSLRINKSKLASNDPQLADIFSSLGGVHGSLQNIEKSVFCYEKSVSIYTEVFGEQSEKVASSLAGKGETLRSDEQFNEALSCFTQCLDIRKVTDFPTVTTATADVLCQMAEIHSLIGDLPNAASTFASALSTYRHIHGTRHESVADVLQKMSDHFVKAKEFERGYSCVKEALSLRQELFGEEDEKTGNSHYCMGTILFEWKNYGESTKNFERARDIYKQKLGDSHLNVASSIFYLGCICERKGEYDLATSYLQESLAGKQEHLDEMDDEIADNLARLGHVYLKKSEWDPAVTSFSDCLKIREATRGTDTASQLHVADTLFDLGTALQKALDTQRSMQLFSDALKEYQRHLEDPKDIKIAKCHSCIGEIYEKTNELLKAVKALETATGIYEHHIGDDPKEKEIRATKNIDAFSGQAETLFRLATAKDRLGEEVTALKQYRRAMRLYKALFGRDNLHVAKILNRLANMKGRAGSVDKAMVLFDESLRIRMLHLGNNHEDVAETLFGMGIVFEKRRDYGAAMKAYSDCLRIRSSKFGSDSMEVAQVVVNIGVVRGNKGDFSGALKSWNKALSIYRKHGLGDDDALVATVLGHQRLANQLKRRSRHKH